MLLSPVSKGHAGEAGQESTKERLYEKRPITRLLGILRVAPGKHMADPRGIAATSMLQDTFRRAAALGHTDAGRNPDFSIGGR